MREVGAAALFSGLAKLFGQTFALATSELAVLLTHPLRQQMRIALHLRHPVDDRVRKDGDRSAGIRVTPLEDAERWPLATDRAHHAPDTLAVERDLLLQEEVAIQLLQATLNLICIRGPFQHVESSVAVGDHDPKIDGGPDNRPPCALLRRALYEAWARLPISTVPLQVCAPSWMYQTSHASTGRERSKRRNIAPSSSSQSGPSSRV